MPQYKHPRIQLPLGLWLSVHILNLLGEEEPWVTRARRAVRPAWNTVRPGRLLALLAAKLASRTLPDATTPNLAFFNDETRPVAPNCLAFPLGLANRSFPAERLRSKWAEGEVNRPVGTPSALPVFRRDTRSGDFLALLHLEGGIRRAHLWDLRKEHAGAYLVALLAEDGDAGEDFHFILLANDGSWYHKPGDQNASLFPREPHAYSRDYRLRGYYWLVPGQSTTRSIEQSLGTPMLHSRIHC